MPLLSGMRAFFYPSPAHYRIVPEMIYEVNASVVFATNTFLNAYAHYAHPYDFYSVRYVYAGAEKIEEETRHIWGERFGVRIFESYGATETSPVLAANTPMENKTGTVGRMLPGMQYKFVPVEGVAEGGRLWVKGPNIMLGYLLQSQPGMLQPVVDDWFDTGDIACMDEEGYLTIIGRATRFAKVGGEVVSLAAVEELVTQVWPREQHAVVSLLNANKSEHLVLVTTQVEAQRSELLDYASGEGITEMWIPEKILCVKGLPQLGSGKVDYPATQRLVNDYYQN